jgi:hypothetical protein
MFPIGTRDVAREQDATYTKNPVEAEELGGVFQTSEKQIEVTSTTTSHTANTK